jgi:tetratricopeptide (TPR) repeat protein
MLKGDFKFLRRLPAEEFDRYATLLTRKIPELPPDIASELLNLSRYGKLLKQNPEAIKFLEEAYQSSPLFYNTLHGVGKQITAKNLNAYSPISYNKFNTYLNPPAKPRSLRNTGTLAGLGLATAIEPATGLMNTFKHAIGYVPSETIAKIPYFGNKINNAINYSNKYLVTDPTIKAFNAGLTGAGVNKYTKLREYLKKFLFNPLSSDIEHGSLGVGTALRKLKLLSQIKS